MSPERGNAGAAPGIYLHVHYSTKAIDLEVFGLFSITTFYFLVQKAGS